LTPTGAPVGTLYDDVVVSSIERYLEADSGALGDAVLLLDVLEHFEQRPQGQAMLQQLRLRLTPEGRLFVGTPAVWMDQGAAYGNEFERHRSTAILERATNCRRSDSKLLDGGADRPLSQSDAPWRRGKIARPRAAPAEPSTSGHPASLMWPCLHHTRRSSTTNRA
jgi:hypothetical protein